MLDTTSSIIVTIQTITNFPDYGKIKKKCSELVFERFFIRKILLPRCKMSI